MKKLSHSKILIFGMDGNVLDNYSLKSTCAGEALHETALKCFEIDKDIKYFASIYIKTSGMNSIEQFRIAYSSITDLSNISNDILQQTEQLFREKLAVAEKDIKIFEDIKVFIQNLDGSIYHTVITTTVPIDNITRLVEATGIDSMFELICARQGIWTKKGLINIEGFDKGPQHFNYIRKYFNTKKEDMIAFSSTTSDVKNAIDYGIVSIAVKHIHDKTTLEKLKPSQIIEDYTKASALLEKF